MLFDPMTYNINQISYNYYINKILFCDLILIIS